MDKTFLMNKKLQLQYALKKDGKERHGTESERFLAQHQPGAEAPVKREYNFPVNELFSDGTAASGGDDTNGGSQLPPYNPFPPGVGQVCNQSQFSSPAPHLFV